MIGVFDLTITQRAWQYLIHPELPICTISIDLKLSLALPSNIEVLRVGGKFKKCFLTILLLKFQRIAFVQTDG